MRLLSKLLGGEDEVLGHDGELVQDQEVGRAEIRDVEGCRGVSKRVDGLRRGGPGWIRRRALGLIGQRGREAKLKLNSSRVI